MNAVFFRNYFSGVALLITIVFLSSCKKDSISIQYNSINTGITSDFYKIKKAGGDTIYLCGGNDTSGFILKSTDNGTTWKNFQNGFWEKILDLDFANNHTILAASRYINFFRTIDNGSTWQMITPSTDQYPLSGYEANLYSIDMVNDSIGYACGGQNFQQGFIYRTNDGGTTWHLKYCQHEMRSVLMYDAFTGYAAGYGVIYKTTDGGENWNVTNASNDFFTGICKSSANQFYSCGFEGSILNTKIESKSWNTKNKSNKAFSKRTHFNCIHFYDSKTGAAAGVNGVIYITHDGGNSWLAGEGFDETQVNSILLISTNTGIAAGNGGRLYKFDF